MPASARVLLVLMLVAGACGGSRSGGGNTVSQSPSPTTAPTEESRTLTTTTSGFTATTAASSSTVALPVIAIGGLAGADSLVKSVTGSTYGAIAAKGLTAHQSSDFGKFGSWTLFTVDNNGRWYAFT